MSADSSRVQWQLNKGLLGDSLRMVPLQFHLNTSLAPKPFIRYNPQPHPVNELTGSCFLRIAPSRQHKRPTRVRQHHSIHAMGTIRVPLDTAENMCDSYTRKCTFVLTKEVPCPGEIQNFCSFTDNTGEGKCSGHWQWSVSYCSLKCGNLHPNLPNRFYLTVK